MAARRGQYCTFFGFVLAKKVRTDPRAPSLTRYNLRGLAFLNFAIKFEL